MNPESFSSLPEGQWLLQQVQTAFPNCSADEQLDGVAILCTIQQTIGHPPLFREQPPRMYSRLRFLQER